MNVIHPWYTSTGIRYSPDFDFPPLEPALELQYPNIDARPLSIVARVEKLIGGISLQIDTGPSMMPGMLENDGITDQKIHPFALGLGLTVFLFLMILVMTSAHQRERLQLLAHRAIRSKASDYARNTHDDNRSSQLPLFAKQAAEHGNLRIVKRWVQSLQRDIDAKSDENLTALHYSSRAGHPDVVRLLLEHHADPNVVDERLVSALHFAALGGHGLIVKLLVDARADALVEDIDGQTPLNLAERTGNIGCIRLLQRAIARQMDGTTHAESLTLRTERRSVNNV